LHITKKKPVLDNIRNALRNHYDRCSSDLLQQISFLKERTIQSIQLIENRQFTFRTGMRGTSVAIMSTNGACKKAGLSKLAQRFLLNTNKLLEEFSTHFLFMKSNLILETD